MSPHEHINISLHLSAPRPLSRSASFFGMCSQRQEDGGSWGTHPPASTAICGCLGASRECHAVIPQRSGRDDRILTSLHSNPSGISFLLVSHTPHPTPPHPTTVIGTPLPPPQAVRSERGDAVLILFCRCQTAAKWRVKTRKPGKKEVRSQSHRSKMRDFARLKSCPPLVRPLPRRIVPPCCSLPPPNKTKTEVESKEEERRGGGRGSESERERKTRQQSVGILVLKEMKQHIFSMACTQV